MSVSKLIKSVEEAVDRYLTDPLPSQRQRDKQKLHGFCKYLLQDTRASPTQSYALSKVRKILQDIYKNCCKEVTLLCMLATNRTSLVSLTRERPRRFVKRLSKFWEESPHPARLSYDADQLFAGEVGKLFCAKVQTMVQPSIEVNGLESIDAQLSSTINLSMAGLVSFLQDHEHTCQRIAMVCHFEAMPLPYIDFALDAASSHTAKMEMSLPMAVALLNHTKFQPISYVNT